MALFQYPSVHAPVLPPSLTAEAVSIDKWMQPLSQPMQAFTARRDRAYQVALQAAREAPISRAAIIRRPYAYGVSIS